MGGKPGNGDEPVPLTGTNRSRAGTGGLSEARRYTPRGRTVREAAQAERGDPLRPVFEVFQGGRAEGERRAGGRAAPSRGRPVAPSSSTTDQAGAKPNRTSKPTRTNKPTRTASPRTASTRTAPIRTAPTSNARARKVPTRQEVPAGLASLRPNRPAARRAVKPRPVPGRWRGRRTPALGEPRRRLRLATVIALALFTAIAGRLVQLQVADAKAYAAEGLAARLSTVDIPAPRGAILDRDGNLLVHSVEASYVYADPMLIDDPERTADAIFPVLSGYGITRSELVRKMAKHKAANGRSDNRFEYLARGVAIEHGDVVKAMRLGGINVRRDERREIPGHDLASNILGFIGRGNDHAGLAGLEAGYDGVLRGVDGWRTFEVGERDLAKEIPGGYTEERPARPGSSLQLTINRDLQYAVQNSLSQRMRLLQATFACAIVLDVRTGEVAAQASYPSFDAANPFNYQPAQRKDSCTELVFDPGSVHKAIVIGAALQDGKITPQSTVVVGPTITKGGTVYRDSHPHYKETPLTIPGVLALSSNVGTIKIADQVGKDALYSYQRKFGLGARTGVGLPGEAPGQVLPPGEWTGSSPGSIPIGNGVATTAMQMAAVYATIANDGVWVQPHLLRATIAPDGKRTPAGPIDSHRVLDPGHAAELRTMLEGVTTLDDATGRLAAIPGYRVAGKTGTSKLPQDGGYADGDVVSFIGMAPADAPRYVVAVTAYVPRGAGGSVAAPAFQEMMAFTLGHFQVLPTGTEPPKLTIYP